MPMSSTEIKRMRSKSKRLAQGFNEARSLGKSSPGLGDESIDGSSRRKGRIMTNENIQPIMG
jgi:hypothetical protein